MGSAVQGTDESGSRTDGPAPVSKPTPTVEAGMPLFSSGEISHLFQETVVPEKKEHPIFVGMEDDVVEMAAFNVYSDKLTLRQSLDARLSDAGWQAMLGRLEELDPKLAAETFYEKRSADRFFSSQAPGGAVDRPNPGAIDFRTVVGSALKAIREIGD
ncbi:MAG: hypothetical protein R3F07_06535 [Opitutaceae bacterium]